MSNLDAYLTDQFLAERQQLAAIKDEIQKTGQTLVDAFTPKGWPYRIRAVADGSPSKPPRNLSHSTTAMVALSLFKLVGAWRRPSNYGESPWFPPPDVPCAARAKIIADKAFKLLVDDLTDKTTVSTYSGSVQRQHS